MRIELDEKMISEFIGADLEPLKGKDSPIKNDIVFTNGTNDTNTPPQTTDNFRDQARMPWWYTYLVGGSVFPYIGGGLYEEVARGGSPIDGRGEKMDLSQIRELFGDEALYSAVKEVINEFTHLPDNHDNQKDIDTIKAIVLSAMMDYTDFSNLDDDTKNALRSKIR